MAWGTPVVVIGLYEEEWFFSVYSSLCISVRVLGPPVVTIGIYEEECMVTCWFCNHGERLQGAASALGMQR